MKIKNTQLEILKGNMDKLRVHAIVREVNTRLRSKDGIDVPLKKTYLKPGESVEVRTNRLKPIYIIYCATMDKDFKSDETKVRLSCRSALRLADTLKLESIAFSPLGDREGNIPLIGIAKIMTQEVLKYLRENTTRLSKVIFCLADEGRFKIFDKNIRQYLEHILYKFTEGPFVTVDAIIELKNGIVLIKRSNPPYGWALPGGFVDYGESLEEAVSREAKEETGLTLVHLRQLHTYSKPERDPRFHTIATVFIARGKGQPRSGDDAQDIRVVPYPDLLKLTYAFDHKRVIGDYLKIRRKGRR